MVRAAGRGRPPGGPQWAILSRGPPGGRALPVGRLSLLPAAQNTERAEEGDTEVLQGGASRVQKRPPRRLADVLERFKKCCSRFGRAALCRGRVQGRKTRPGRSRALPGLRLHFFLICSSPSGIMVDGEDCREIVERDLENGECASIRPPPRGGAARRKMVCGLRVRSGRKGRRGEYWGWPWMQAFAWSIRREIDSFVGAGGSRDCRDGRPQYSPRRGPCRLSFAMHPRPLMAAPPPSRRGVGPVALLVPCIRGIPEVVPL